MIGYRFYEEYESGAHKRRHQTDGNVVALHSPVRLTHTGTLEAVVGLYDWPDSAVASGSVSPEILASRFRRVGETHARALHPRLFEYLEGRES